MKKLFSLMLAVCLLALPCGCASQSSMTAQDVQSESPPPQLIEPAEDITYEVVITPYQQTVTAEDGTELMRVSFQIPHLQAYSDGVLVETPATQAQEAALERVEIFNESFDLWREADTTEENIASAKAHYEAEPAWFDADGELYYAEDLSCTVYRLGSLISVSASYYSYLGGAHPNTVYFSWNFDLESGIFLTIPELTADPQAFTLAVADMIEVQAEARFLEDPGHAGLGISDIYWENYREIMEKWGSDYAASFDAEGLTVIFSAYELAPYAAGAQEFHFPYAALDSYWSDSGRAVLGMD